MAAGVTPSVSVVVVAHNAAAHLTACLESLARLDYPRDRVEVVVVDNASTDGTLALLHERFPWARVLPQRENVGFAAANNLAAAHSSSDCLALLNADMRVEPTWLRELTAQLDAGDRCCCVSSLILDWEGRRVDFGGGVLNFGGHGNQLGHGLPVEQVALEDGRELPFACGGAMLVDRRVFLDAGGFDPTYFIYFEDVDLGWRLRLLGSRVRLAARARAYHRGHGTTSDFRAFQVRLLYERNALRTLIKNLEEHNLHRLLAASLLLVVERARLATGSRRAPFEVGAGAGSTREEVERLGLAPLHAVGDVVAELDELLQRRHEIQRRRRVPDAEIFRLFGRPFQPAGRDDDPYLETLGRVTRAFGLEALFTERPATRALVIGDGAAAADVARALAQRVPVALASEGPIAHAPDGVEARPFVGGEEIASLAYEADLVVASAAALARHPRLRAGAALLALDARATPTDAVVGGELLGAVDVVLTDGERPVTGAQEAGVLALQLADAAADDALAPLVDEPWRWRRERPAVRGAVTEETQLLLRRRRRERDALLLLLLALAGRRSRAERLARRAYGALPEPARRALRSLRRR